VGAHAVGEVEDGGERGRCRIVQIEPPPPLTVAAWLQVGAAGRPGGGEGGLHLQQRRSWREVREGRRGWAYIYICVHVYDII
jgi:hypothetical protein